MEWAVSESKDGFVNKYEISMDDLRILDLSGSEFNILNWLTILLNNRVINEGASIAREAKRYLDENFSVDYESFDIIKGYRADDSYFSFARDFLNNTISLEALSKAMKLGKLGEQIVLKSEKTFERIQFMDAIRAESSIHYSNKEKREKKARSEYRLIQEAGFVRGETYILNIIDKELKSHDLFI